EIGDLMGMSRSAVQRHRTKTLNELRKKLKAHLPEGG
ncbi:sigma-70 family RNA polymerase sigma factor, partial [Faecalibacterium sp. AF10-46]